MQHASIPEHPVLLRSSFPISTCSCCTYHLSGAIQLSGGRRKQTTNTRLQCVPGVTPGTNQAMARLTATEILWLVVGARVTALVSVAAMVAHRSFKTCVVRRCTSFAKTRRVRAADLFWDALTASYCTSANRSQQHDEERARQHARQHGGRTASSGVDEHRPRYRWRAC